MDSLAEKTLSWSMVPTVTGFVGVYAGHYWTLSFLNTLGAWALAVGIFGLVVAAMIDYIERNG